MKTVSMKTIVHHPFLHTVFKIRILHLGHLIHDHQLIMEFLHRYTLDMGRSPLNDAIGFSESTQRSINSAKCRILLLPHYACLHGDFDPHSHPLAFVPLVDVLSANVLFSWP
jgi:hypothetical protein